MASTQLETFEPFPRLPVELRTAIWVLAIPRRIINPCSVGHISAPGPPTIAYVCHESRTVALRNGQPTDIGSYNSRPSSCWFTPSRDFVLFSPDKVRTVSMCHPIIDHKLWWSASTIVVQFEWKHRFDSNYLNRSLGLRLASHFPNIREIMFWPIKTRTFGTLFRQYGHFNDIEDSVGDELFGADSVRIVDLKDSAEVNAVAALLCRTDTGMNTTRVLHWAQDMFLNQGTTKVREESEEWQRLVGTCKLQWLQAQYNIQTEADQAKRNPVPVLVNSESEINLDDSWIRSTLDQLPRIRPVFVLAKHDGDVRYDGHSTSRGVLQPTRERRSKPWPTPEFIFNDEFKLWVKHGEDEETDAKRDSLNAVFHASG